MVMLPPHEEPTQNLYKLFVLWTGAAARRVCEPPSVSAWSMVITQFSKTLQLVIRDRDDVDDRSYLTLCSMLTMKRVVFMGPAGRQDCRKQWKVMRTVEGGGDRDHM